MFSYNSYMFSKPRIRNLLVLILLVYVLKLTVWYWLPRKQIGSKQAQRHPQPKPRKFCSTKIIHYPLTAVAGNAALAAL